MNTRISTKVTITNVANGLSIKQGHSLEASLDCYQCKKRIRTVAIAYSKSDTAKMRRVVSSYAKGIPESDSLSICLPTGHDFPAKVIGFQVEYSKDTAVISTTFEYEYRPFVAETRWKSGPSSPDCTWIRTNFQTTCPQCKDTRNNSVQTNLVRPHNRICKPCGLLLYIDSNPPVVVAQTVN